MKGPAGTVLNVVAGVKALTDSGILTPRVDRIAHKVVALRAYGPVPAAGLVAAARSYPERPYVHDEQGTLTFGDVDARTNAIVRGLQAAGIREGDPIPMRLVVAAHADVSDFTDPDDDLAWFATQEIPDLV